jgi:hypothetical protein
MRLIKDVLLLFRRFLLLLLLFYWAAFIGYTVAKFIEGGLGRVASYYEYLTCEYILGLCRINWRAFCFVQGFYLAITLLLCFFEWRTLRANKQAEKVQVSE